MWFALLYVLGKLSPGMAFTATNSILSLLLSTEKKVDLTGDMNPDRFEVAAADGTIVIRKTDLDGDGKVDVIDYFDNHGELYKREIASNPHGKIDLWVFFNSDGTLRKEFDTDQDGTIDRIEESFPRGDKLYVRTKTLLNKQNKTFKESFNTHPLMQPEKRKRSTTAAPSDPNAGNTTSLGHAIDNTGKLRPLSDPQKGFHQTPFGFLIQERCLSFDKNSDLPQILFNALDEGTACLWKLGEKIKTSPNFPRLHVAQMATLLKDSKNPPKLYCAFEDFPKITAEAVASASASKTPGANFSHPSVVLNMPHFLKLKETEAKTYSQTLKRTIFHELFHNLGQQHGRSVEYSYACSDFCFSDASREDVSKISEKICRGEYPNQERDLDYLKDLTVYLKKRYLTEDLVTALINALQENPQDPTLRWLLVKAYQTPLGAPYAYALAETLDPNSLPEDERAALEALKKESTVWLNRPDLPQKMFYETTAKPLAKALDLALEKKYPNALSSLFDLRYPSKDSLNSGSLASNSSTFHEPILKQGQFLQSSILSILEAKYALWVEDLKTKPGDKKTLEGAEALLAAIRGPLRETRFVNVPSGIK